MLKQMLKLKSVFSNPLKLLMPLLLRKGSVISKFRLSNSTHWGLRLIVGKGAQARSGLGRRLQGISQAINVNGKKDKYGLGLKPKRV